MSEDYDKIVEFVARITGLEDEEAFLLEDNKNDDSHTANRNLVIRSRNIERQTHDLLIKDITHLICNHCYGGKF